MKSKLLLYLRIAWRKNGTGIILFTVSLLATAILSASLLLVAGNDALNAQGTQYGFLTAEINRTLGVFSFAAILIVIWGQMTLFFFRNRRIERSLGVCKIFGMNMQDLCLFSLTDWLVCGVTAQIPGILMGTGLAKLLADRLYPSASLPSLTVKEASAALLPLSLALSVLTFGGSLSAVCTVYDKKYGNLFLDRGEPERGQHSIVVMCTTVALLLPLVRLMFPDAWQINVMLLIICSLSALLLFALFRFFFACLARRRYRRPLCSPRGISLRFLCSRGRRAAGLSAVISVGALLICFAGNLIFHFDGILRESYRENMGYTVCLRVTDWHERENIAAFLDQNGYRYTCLYSKRMDYRALDGCEAIDGKFWVALIHRQTDDNTHFAAPAHEFLAENYFSTKLGLTSGACCDALGSQLRFAGRLTDRQALSLVNYNVLLRESDWNYGVDDSYSCVFLLDIRKGEEKRLRLLTEPLPCEMETASELVDALFETMRNYFGIVVLMFFMLVLVTTTFYFATIQSDLRQRKTEFLLYRIYGAPKRTVKHIFCGEYLLIGVISSFCVVSVMMLLFELLFSVFFGRHYPLSLPVLLLTTLLVNGFISLCCYTAGLASVRDGQTELIRDE